MPGTLRALTATAIVVPLLVLAGCGDGPGDGSADPSSDVSPSGEPTESPSETSTGSSPTSAPADPSETSTPGSVLKFGETATVPIGDDGVIAVTPLSVKKAPPAEVRGQLAADETGWYAWLQVEIVSESKSGDIQLSAPGVNIRVMAGGNPAFNLLYSEQKTCSYPFEPAKPAVGDTWKTCVPVKLAKGQAPDELLYTELGTRYDRVDGKPVVWRLDS